MRSRRRAPRQRTDRPGGSAARSNALSAPSSAAGRRACGRPRRGAVAAVLPHWDDDDDRLPGGRLTRALPPRANGHGRGAWCERRNRAASARWAPRLPGQPASGLHPHALVRAAVDHFDRGRRGLWVRHARTHAQSNTHAARGLTVRRSPSGARVATWCHGSRAGVTGGRAAVTRWCLQCNTSWRGLGLQEAVGHSSPHCRSRHYSVRRLLGRKQCRCNFVKSTEDTRLPMKPLVILTTVLAPRTFRPYLACPSSRLL